MRRPDRVIVVGLFSFLLTTFAPRIHAQQASEQVPGTVLRATTRLVLVDVVVTDHWGLPVTDLTENDFSITENGKPQKISSFASHSAADDAKSRKAPPLLEPHVTSNRPEFRQPDAPAVVLLLDGLNTAGSDQLQVKQQMLRYLAVHYDPHVKIAVLTLTGEIHVLQDFTSDPTLLSAALQHYRALSPAAARAGGERDVTDVTNSMLRQMPAVSSQAGTAGGGQPTLDPAIPRSSGGANSSIGEQIAYLMQRFENEAQNYARDQRISMTLTALREIARYMAGQKGRKSLLWFSAGFPIGVTGFDAVDLDTSRAYADKVRETTNLLADAHIAIYTIDARGLVAGRLGDVADAGLKGRIAGPELNRALETETYQRFNEEDTMERVALETGGLFFRDNDFARALEMSIRDTSTYYLIGYYPADKKWDGKFRKIQVKVNRTGIHLQHRSGYFASDPFDWRKGGGEETMAAAIKGGPLQATEVLFFARALPPSQKSDLKVEFLVDPRTISFETASENQRYCNVQFEVQSLTADGKIVKTEVQTAEAPLKRETYDRVQKQGLPMSMEIKLPPGHYRLRLGVRDNRTGLFGTAELPVDVPSA
jgi:VWFA-related protein